MGKVARMPWARVRVFVGQRIATFIFLAVALLGGTPEGASPAGGAAPAEPRTLVVESIELLGVPPSSLPTTLLYFPVREGEPISSAALADALHELQESHLFESVELTTAPGSEKGKVRLALEARENGLEFNVGTGVQDLSGWYLIPAQLALDNPWGHGEQLRLQARIGYRVTGLELLFEKPRFGDGKNFWGASFTGHALQHVYFVDGVEYEHKLGRGGLEGHLGRWFRPSWRYEFGLGLEGVDAEATSAARESDDVLGVNRGDILEGDSLPEGVGDDLGKRNRSAAHFEIVHDSRSRELLAATPVRGVWGRVRAEAVGSKSEKFGALTTDVRLFRAVKGAVFALRLRGGVVGDEAPFYDRFHLGGLYTVRGFPSQALTPPEGSTVFGCGSLELRAPLVGRAAEPRISGLLFVDVGHDEDDASAGMGFGVRVRVPWVESLGLDLGVPLTDGPIDEAFHGNASIGWSF